MIMDLKNQCEALTPDAMDGMKMKIEASVKTYEPVKMEFQDSQQEIAGE